MFSGQKRLVPALLAAALAAATITAQTPEAAAQAATPSVCDRTPAIRDAIVAALNNQACATITNTQLATITSLGHVGIAETITALTAGDFASLTGLTRLNLNGLAGYEEGSWITTGKLTTLPAGVFDKSTNLQYLDLRGNQLTTLPTGIFTKNTNLETLGLDDNQLTTLPTGIFTKNTNLRLLGLADNQLTTLPTGIFTKNTNLQRLWLFNNQLTVLRDGVFAGLDNLTELYLWGNAFVVPPVRVFLIHDSGVGSVVAWMPSGAPAATTVTIAAFNALPARSSVVVPAGGLVSPPVDLTSTGGEVSLSLAASWPDSLSTLGGVSPVSGGVVADVVPVFGADVVVVDQQFGSDETISPVVLPAASGGNGGLVYSLVGSGGGSLPEGLVFDTATRTLSGTPAVAGGYSVSYRVMDVDGDMASLSFWIIVGEPAAVPSVCDRTPAIRNAIVRVLGNQDCATITDEQLATINPMPSIVGSFSALKAGDFSGMSGLTSLNLNNRGLETLPSGTFDGLTSLATLRLDSNSLAALPEDIFDGLDALASLRLEYNSLAALPEGVFDGLSNLAAARLEHNSLAALPTGVFDGLDALASLRLDNNSLTALPTGVFDGLDELTTVYANNNRLAGPLPDGLFDGLGSLQYVYFDRNPGAPFQLPVIITYDPAAETATASIPTGVPAAATISLQTLHTSPGVGPLTIPAGQTTSPSAAVTPVVLSPPSDEPVQIRVRSAAFAPSPGVDIQGFGFNARPRFGTQTVGALTWGTNTAIDAVKLPVVYGGDGLPTYTLSIDGGTGLPEGVVFDAATRTISGTPTRKGDYTLAYRAADTDSDTTEADTDTLRIAVTIRRTPLEFDHSLPDSFLVGSVTSYPLPTAVGGEGQLTYSIQEISRSAIMNLDPATRALTMNRTRYVTFEYIVTDEAGATDKMCLTTRTFGGVDTQNNLFYYLTGDPDNGCTQATTGATTRGVGGDSDTPRPPIPADGLPPNHPSYDDFYNYFANQHNTNTEN